MGICACADPADITPTSPRGQRVVAFEVGESYAETERNRVHVIDRTNDRLITIDTDSGNVLASTGLMGKPAYGALMSVSLDGSTLCVPLTSSSKLQFVSLSDLTTRDIVSTGVPPGSTAAGADGQIYVTSGDKIYKVDPVSGAAVGVLSGYYAPLLKGNADGTRLYVMELGLSGGGETVVELAVVPGGSPQFTHRYGPGKANDKDFEINEADGLIYTTAGGVYGINAIDVQTGSTRFWSFDAAYGAAVAFQPGGDFVYGASGDAYVPRIRRFDRLTGSISATFDLKVAGSYSVRDRSLQVTPNGHIFFSCDNNLVGVIGATNIMPTLPSASVPVDLGHGKTVDVGMPLRLSAAGATTKGALSWAKRQGPGAVTFSEPAADAATAVFALPGTYLVEATYSENGHLSRDAVTVVVQQAPRQIITQGAPMRWRVPASAAEITGPNGPWYTNTFDDSGWRAGPTAIGYESRPEGFYDPLIGTGVASAMKGRSRTALLRIPFNFAFLTGQIQSLELHMRFDDGFVAYLNGVPIARANAAAGDQPYNAGATGQRTAAQALAVSVFDLGAQRNLLRKGENLLAIQALNFDANDSAFLCLPELVATVQLTPFEAWLSGFSGISAEASGPDADADHDGRSNWLEFAMGGNPAHAETASELGALQVKEQVVAENGIQWLEVTYLRRTDPVGAGLSCRLLFANDLDDGSWRLAGSSRFPAKELSVRPSAIADMDSVRVRLDLPLEEQEAVFSRLSYE
jgi:hypothetical protein